MLLLISSSADSIFLKIYFLYNRVSVELELQRDTASHGEVRSRKFSYLRY